MPGNLMKEWVDPFAINTPLIGVSVVSLFFNSVLNGVMRVSNFYTNFTLFVLLGLSNGFYNTLHNPLRGAQLGLCGSALFTLGAPARVLFTNRLFPRYVHYGIGSFYCTYHSLQWYKAVHYFEDAGEDEEDERL